MTTLYLNNVGFQGFLNRRTPATHSSLQQPKQVRHTFTFGKSFLLECAEDEAGFVLSWIIGGEVEPDYGEITKDGILYPSREQKKMPGLFAIVLYEQVR